MVAFSSLVSVGLLVATSASAAPLHQKRIAQTIADSTAKWVAACQKAGGAEQCSTISQTAFTTLLAAGKNCDQQDAADQMVSLAKTLNNDPDMISLAQIFVQQPRNAPDSLQVPYCQTAPKNPELNGFFHCQFQGTVASGKFSGDQTGNLPLGVSAVNPPGSCPALNTPVTDGQQLNSIVSNPGKPASAAAAAPKVGTRAVASPDPSKPFLPDNGQQAQQLNAKFATAKAGDACQDGEQACADGAFAQCVAGKLVTSGPCAGGLTCVALPLVNKAGTSVTCDTEADAIARIAATGVSGGLTGSG
ncbi:hypothetical protein BU17DRAFT_63807 [Hysterangium stoloniferum]|nr:hypothetical protein BU17DRAFT_63807 [Hysterangium stoloniferum]